MTPLCYLVYRIFFDIPTDPIKYIYTLTGATAITLLFATTTISIVKKLINFMQYKKTVGLMTFFYALLHLTNFFVLDAEMELEFIIEETLDKPFVYFGMISVSILLFMAITSTKSLFKKLNKYHQLIYIVLILTTIHFVMAQKSLSIEQMIYLLIIALIGTLKILQKTKIVKL
jgi:sulfoxide reductase heme-binding subunit YedZ